MLNDRSAMVLLALAFSNALLHALIPSHWLSFALVGKANRWSMRTALGVTALAGSGHILFTVALGLAVAGAGKEVARHIPPLAEHAAAAVALILLGLYFIVRGIRQSGCQHPGHRHSGDHAHDPAGGESSQAQPAAVGALVLGMTLSPCLDLLSLYVAAASFPWVIVGAMSVVMAATTLTLMLTLVWLTLHGLKRVKLDWLEKNEGLVVGAILMALGIYLFFAR